MKNIIITSKAVKNLQVLIQISVLLLLILAIIASASYAQTPNWLWAKSAVGADDDAPTGVAVDPSENIYVVGNFLSSSIAFGNSELNNAGGGDIFLVRYDQLGNVVWAKSAGGSSSDVATAVETDAQGNIYVSGYFYSSSIAFGSTTLYNTGGVDAFLVKYDATTGSAVWARSITGSNNDNIYSVTVDASNNVYVTGNFQSSSIVIGTSTLINHGSTDFFIAKYDASGNALWANSAGNEGLESGAGVGVDATGNIVVGGNFNSSTITFGSITLNKTGTGNMFVAKYNPSGDVLWASCSASPAGAGAQGGGRLAMDTSRNVIVIGEFGSASMTLGNFTLLNSDPNSVADGHSGLFVAKYDSLGSVQWAKKIGSVSDIHHFAGIASDIPGNAYVSGYFQGTLSFGSLTLSKPDGWALFLAKYDKDGDVVWAITPSGYLKVSTGTTLPPYLDFGMDVNSDGNAIISTDFLDATTTLGNFTLTNSNPGDAETFVAMYGIAPCPTATITPSGTVTVCSGTSVTLTANSGIGLNYQWKKGTKDIVGATNQTYTTTKAGAYKVVESNNFGCSSTSAATTIVTIAAPNASITPLGNLDICQTGSVVLQANSGAGLTYQWMKGSSILSGETNQNYTATAKATYKVKVTNSNGCSKTSAGVKVTKSCSPKIADDNATSSKDFIIQNTSLNLFPNPTNGTFTLEIKSNETQGDGTIQLLNLLGENILSEHISFTDGVISKQINLDRSLPNGIYMVKAVINGELYSAQIVLQK